MLKFESNLYEAMPHLKLIVIPAEGPRPLEEQLLAVGEQESGEE